MASRTAPSASWKPSAATSAATASSCGCVSSTRTCCPRSPGDSSPAVSVSTTSPPPARRSRPSSSRSWAAINAPDERPPMNRLLTIVHLTLHEAMRKRILLATTLCGIAFLALYAVGYHFIAKNLPNETGAFVAGRRLLQLSAFTLAGLYAVNFLTVMSAVLIPVDTLSGEITSGVMQTLASKPIRRGEMVLGKWLAYSGVVAVYVLALAGGVLAIARVTGGYTHPHAYVGLPLMMFEGILLVSLSIWGGVRFSTVTNGIVAFGLYGIAFLGSWVEQVGAWSHNP